MKSIPSNTTTGIASTRVVAGDNALGGTRALAATEPAGVLAPVVVIEVVTVVTGVEIILNPSFNAWSKSSSVKDLSLVVDFVVTPSGPTGFVSISP